MPDKQTDSEAASEPQVRSSDLLDAALCIQSQFLIEREKLKLKQKRVLLRMRREAMAGIERIERALSGANLIDGEGI